MMNRSVLQAAREALVRVEVSLSNLKSSKQRTAALPISPKQRTAAAGEKKVEGDKEDRIFGEG